VRVVHQRGIEITRGELGHNRRENTNSA
jgi:hypothetical protein